MSSIPSHFNFAKAIGIESLAGAIIFVILYVCLLALFARKSFTHPTFVHYVLTVFCTIRVTAFMIRAILAGSTSAGESLGLVIADEVLFGVGYFSLLYSAYILVLDRIKLSDLPPPKHPLLILAQNRRVFHIALLVAVVLGIVASSNTNSNGTNSSTTNALHIASAVIFQVLTSIQAFQTINLARSNARSQHKIGGDFLGIQHTYGIYILLIISLLLLIREAFAMATVTDSAKQNNEHFWYPFLAVTEVLVVILFAAPGLVPRKDELPSYSLAETS